MGESDYSRSCWQRINRRLIGQAVLCTLLCLGVAPVWGEPASEWIFETPGKVEVFAPQSGHTWSQFDGVQGVRLAGFPAAFQALDLPVTAAEGQCYRFEAELAYRVIKHGPDEVIEPLSKVAKYVGLRFARRDAADKGLLFFTLPDNDIFLLDDDRDGNRLTHLWDVRPTPDAAGWSHLTLGVEMQRGDAGHLPAILMFKDGLLQGEHLLPVNQFDSAGPHGCSVVVSGAVELIVKRVRFQTVQAEAYPFYPARGEMPTAAEPLPRSTEPSDTVYMLSIASQPYEEALMGVVLQGLVNRTRPRLMTDFHGYESQSPQTPDWGRLAEASGRKLIRGQALDALVERFADEVKGVALYDLAWATDPAMKPALNTVITLCGLDGLLPMTPQQYARIGKSLKMPVAFDARGQWADGRASLAWAVENLLPRCSRRGIVHNQVHQPNLACLDYAVANQMFVFMSAVGDGDRAELQAYERILSHTAPCTPIMGMSYLMRMGGRPVNYFSEGVIFDLAAEMGKYFLYTMSSGNLSYHSGMEIAPRQKPVEKLVYDPGKIYLLFFASDGDNNSWSMNLRLNIDGHPSRGRYPIAWSLAPTMGYLCPDVVQYYYDHAPGGERYIASGGGIGVLPYTQALERFAVRLEPEAREAARGHLLELSEAAFVRGDLKVLNPFAINRKDLTRMAEGMPSLRLILPGYNKPQNDRPLEDRIFKLGGTWVARFWGAHPGGGDFNNPAQARVFAEGYLGQIREATEKG